MPRAAPSRLIAYRPPTGIPRRLPGDAIAWPSAGSVPPMQKVGMPIAATASSSFTSAKPAGKGESQRVEDGIRLAVEIEDRMDQQRSQPDADLENPEGPYGAAPALRALAERAAARGQPQEEAGERRRRGQGRRSEEGGEPPHPEDFVDETQSAGDEEENGEGEAQAVLPEELAFKRRRGRRGLPLSRRTD